MKTKPKSVENKPPAYNEQDLYHRALAAYFRGSKGVATQPSDDNSGVYAEVGGKVYVVLANVNGVLAVYRYRNTGLLRRLVRWPKHVGK